MVNYMRDNQSTDQNRAAEISGSPAPAAHESTGTARILTPAAQRALAEAEERRRREKDAGSSRPREIGGRDGPEPVRYGDWEKGGIVSDF